MISINLLPVREWKKRESVRRQISIFFLSIFLLLAGLLAVGSTIQGKVMMQRQELKKLQAQKRKLAYVNRKIRSVQQTRKEVESKFKSIEKLQEGRTFAVKAIDEIVTALPLNRLWLTSLRLDKQSMSLAGVALDNHTIALFMKRIETSPVYSKVKLKNSEQKNIQGHNLMDFALDITIKQADNKKNDNKEDSNKKKK